MPDKVEAVVLQKRYLTPQRRSVAAVCREIARECGVAFVFGEDRQVLPGMLVEFLLDLVEEGVDLRLVIARLEPGGDEGDVADVSAVSLCGSARWRALFGSVAAAKDSDAGSWPLL